MTISVYVDVEANSPDEAIVKAEQSAVQSLCYHCSHPPDDVWQTSGELDGEPRISAEDIEEV